MLCCVCGEQSRFKKTSKLYEKSPQNVPAEHVASLWGYTVEECQRLGMVVHKWCNYPRHRSRSARYIAGLKPKAAELGWLPNSTTLMEKGKKTTAAAGSETEMVEGVAMLDSSYLPGELVGMVEEVRHQKVQAVQSGADPRVLQAPQPFPPNGFNDDGGSSPPKQNGGLFGLQNAALVKNMQKDDPKDQQDLQGLLQVLVATHRITPKHTLLRPQPPPPELPPHNFEQMISTGRNRVGLSERMGGQTRSMYKSYDECNMRGTRDASIQGRTEEEGQGDARRKTNGDYGLQKILHASRGLALRLHGLIEAKLDHNLKKELFVAKELSKNLLQYVEELAQQGSTPGCKTRGCSEPAVYDWPNVSKGRLCNTHKLRGMVSVSVHGNAWQGLGVMEDLLNRGSEQAGCDKAYPELFPVQDMMDVKNKKKCEGERRSRFCGPRKKQGMVNAKSKRCEQAGCSRAPLFSWEGEQKGKFCAEHKLQGMTHIGTKQRRCEHVECGKVASFNLEGEQRGRFCTQHREQGMVDVKTRKCEQAGCSKHPSFNFKGERRGRFCGQHKEQGMVDVMNKKCEQTGGCGKVPNFNFEGEKRGRFCGQHKLEGMVDVKTRKCAQAGCGKHPSFNFEGERRGRFCVQHKEQGMVYVANKTCEHARCGKQPCFNFEGEKKSRFCGQHKAQGMVYVKSMKSCGHDGCSKRPVFSWEGEQKGKFCAEHKEQGMVCVTTKRCEQAGCTTGPAFNFEGEQRGRFCTQHKEQGMVDVKTRKCEYAGCSKVACFNFEGERRGRFCGQHKIQRMVNVRNKKGCEQAGCSKQARQYGFEGEQRGRFCAQHKEKGMVDVQTRKCQNVGCSKQPAFNFTGERRGRFCAEHREPFMVDVRSNRCQQVGCSKKPSFNYEGKKMHRFCAQHKSEGMVDVVTKTNLHL